MSFLTPPTLVYLIARWPPSTVAHTISSAQTWRTYRPKERTVEEGIVGDDESAAEDQQASCTPKSSFGSTAHTTSALFLCILEPSLKLRPGLSGVLSHI